MSAEPDPTELRDELARQLFIADNSRQPKEQSEEDWQEYPGVIAGVTTYHAQADAIMPTVVEAITESRAEGMRDAADIVGVECSHQWQVDQNVARRMVVVGPVIRAQAEALRDSAEAMEDALSFDDTYVHADWLRTRADTLDPA